ncbi:MAG: hypothetical protein ACLFSQ_07405 [Candidatus Zixiibacteriota bacterium]
MTMRNSALSGPVITRSKYAFCVKKISISTFSRKLDVVNRYTDFQERLWDGRDQNGKKAKTGLYFYIISRDGEIICEGTITLIR